MADIRQALRDGTVDLAVVALVRRQQRGLVTRLLTHEEMVLATSPQRDRIGRRAPGRATLDEVDRLPLVDFAPGWAIRNEVDRAFRAALGDRNLAFEVNDVVTAAELVRHDLGVCIVPEPMAASFPDLAVHRFERHAPYWNVMVVRPRGEAPPVVAALLEHFT
nr:LysR substrate-binding domain-containing protein [Streptomyces sp. NBC_00830]WTB35824.1 LysR substrate-binding domain-containing protein [Streptomyces sp. NBC_00830]